jgi:hypothetical protein
MTALNDMSVSAASPSDRARARNLTGQAVCALKCRLPEANPVGVFHRLTIQDYEHSILMQIP